MNLFLIHYRIFVKPVTILLGILYTLSPLATAAQQAKTLGNAKFSYHNGQLAVSTGKVQRVWGWTGSGLLTKSFKNLQTNREWITAQSGHRCDWNLPGAIHNESQAKLLDVQCIETDDEKFTSPHLLVTARIKYVGGLEVKYLIRVYPDAKGIWTALEVRASWPFSSIGLPSDLGFYKSYGSRQPVKIARCEYFPIDFTKQTQRRYWGFYNDPGHRVNTKDMAREEIRSGWPLFADEQITWASGACIEADEEGLLVVKESNKTVNKPGHQTGAFYCAPNGLEVTGWGLKPYEITKQFRRTWATWAILFSGGEDEMELALKQFDRCRYPVNLDTDMHILIDTWGSDWQDGEDGKIYGRENSVFSVIEKEIRSAADLGIDIVRIDDGWQAGKTLSRGTWHPNSEVGYDSDWKKTKALAKQLGVRIGLWTAVRFITQEEMLKNQVELAVATWKLDFDQLAGWESFNNRLKGIRSFIKHANYRTQVSWCPEYDDQRYGWYSPVREYGPMYFQNIQNNLPRHLIYVPYITLRHHWMMSRFYNMNDLQCHWQNPSRTNPNFSDANLHSQSYAAMSAFIASPSCFMLTQLLTPEERKELKRTIAIYKQHRKDIYKSYVFPIGEEPNNSSWIGFQMYHPDKSIGHLIVFRELHNKERNRSLQLKFLKNRTLKINDLSHSTGSRELKTDESGAIDLSIDNPADYRFLKYEILD